MKKALYPAEEETARVIGVAGACEGCGVTHFVWSAANYLSNVAGRRVAVCNFSGKDDYRQAKVILGKPEKEGQFTCGRAVFIESAELRMLAAYIPDYDYLILDLGYSRERCTELMPRCSIRFLIGALDLWNCRKTITTAIHLGEFFGGRLRVMAVFATAEGKKAFRAASGEEIMLIPWEPEPLCLHKDMLVFLEKILRV